MECHQASVNLGIEEGKKIGRKEVVEWIKGNGIWVQVPFKVKECEETMWCLFPSEWQAYLKELGLTEETTKYLAKCGHLVCFEDVVFVRQGNELIPTCISCYEAARDASRNGD